MKAFKPYVYFYCQNEGMLDLGIIAPLVRHGEVVHLENMGREGHVYLNHIITHYDNLADHTIFTQAIPDSGDRESEEMLKARFLVSQQLPQSLTPALLPPHLMEKMKNIFLLIYFVIYIIFTPVIVHHTASAAAVVMRGSDHQPSTFNQDPNRSSVQNLFRPNSGMLSLGIVGHMECEDSGGWLPRGQIIQLHSLLTRRYANFSLPGLR